jgi:hypothetical protein
MSGQKLLNAKRGARKLIKHLTPGKPVSVHASDVMLLHSL